MNTKICAKCKGEFSLSEFTKCNGNKDGLYSWCKSCKREQDRKYYRTNQKFRERVRRNSKKHYESNKEKCLSQTRDIHTLRTFGLTGTECRWLILWKDCEVCGMTNEEHLEKYSRSLNIDHDHNNPNPNYRGVLCHRCNTTLGHFNDDPELIRKLSDYLFREGRYDLH